MKGGKKCTWLVVGEGQEAGKGGHLPAALGGTATGTEEGRRTGQALQNQALAGAVASSRLLGTNYTHHTGHRFKKLTGFWFLINHISASSVVKRRDCKSVLSHIILFYEVPVSSKCIRKGRWM